MMSVPDAPYIREAERRGTDYMYDYVFGAYDNYEEDDENADEDYV